MRIIRKNQAVCPENIVNDKDFLVLRYATYRLIHKRGNEIEMLTVFTKHGAIVCSYESSKEPHYTVSDPERTQRDKYA